MDLRLPLLDKGPFNSDTELVLNSHYYGKDSKSWIHTLNMFHSISQEAEKQNKFLITFDFVSISLIYRFVVDCIMFLENHLKAEGLFRKPGSQSRQRELLVSIV